MKQYNLHRANRIVISLNLIVFAAFLSSCAAVSKKPIPAHTEFALGTVCTVSLFDKGSESLYRQLFDELRRQEALFSANRDDSTIASINRGAGLQPVNVDSETFLVLQAALSWSDRTAGLFDPTIGPLVKLWNIGTDKAAVPGIPEITAARKLIDYRLLRLNTDESTVFLPLQGMKLDLGGIAKGYAADRLAEILRLNGIQSALIDLGGNVLALGSKAPDQDWTIGIRNPLSNAGDPILSVQINNRSVVTSGVYERFFEQDGQRYHHIINPFTGYPQNNGLLSVSIIAPLSIDADALSTSVFLMGREKGLELVNSLPGIDAIFITDQQEVYLSSGLTGKVRVRNSEFLIRE